MKKQKKRVLTCKDETFESSGRVGIGERHDQAKVEKKGRVEENDVQIVVISR